MTDEKKIHILMIEDDREDQLLVRAEFQKEQQEEIIFEIEETLAAGLQRLGKGDIDLVLLDLNLPDSLGLETIEKVRNSYPQIALVVLTGLLDEETAMKALSMGAQDYLEKGVIHGKMLIRIARYSIERKRLEEEVVTRVRELERLNRMMVDRELKMIELKEENTELKRLIERRTGDRDAI